MRKRISTSVENELYMFHAKCKFPSTLRFYFSNNKIQNDCRKPRFILSKFITIFEAPHKIFYLHSAANSASTFILALDGKQFPWDKSINAIQQHPTGILSILIPLLVTTDYSALSTGLTARLTLKPV